MGARAATAGSIGEEILRLSSRSYAYDRRRFGRIGVLIFAKLQAEECLEHAFVTAALPDLNWGIRSELG